MVSPRLSSSRLGVIDHKAGAGTEAASGTRPPCKSQMSSCMIEQRSPQKGPGRMDQGTLRVRVRPRVYVVEQLVAGVDGQ